MKQEKKVLIVDDDPISLHAACHMLSGYHLLCAKTIEEMYSILENEIPDIILLDVMLPGTNGFNEARNFLKEFENHHIPIIFCTAKVSGSNVKEGFESGGSDYIKKPYDKEELSARVAAVLKTNEIQKQLLAEASVDGLTGLYNRRYFYRLLNDRLSYCKRKRNICSIAMIDVDNFKTFNDRWGHTVGDEILRYFGETLLSMIREYDVACRFGGEEFLIALIDCDEDSAHPVIERIQQYLKEKPLVFSEGEAVVTFSCGIASTLEFDKEQNYDIESLISLADRRMYCAKNNGRDRICIH